MTDDQHRIGQLTAARLTVAGMLERWDTTDPAERPAPLALAAWLLDKLQTEHGWRPPVTAEPVPPLRPDRAADPNHRKACMDEIRAVFTSKN